MEKQSIDKKQGSEGLVDNQETCSKEYMEALQVIQNTYKNMIQNGVAKEQARIILPLSLYTECIWTVSLQALFNFIVLRKDSHAQAEIQEYAKILDTIVQEEFPHCYSAIIDEGTLESHQ